MFLRLVRFGLLVTALFFLTSGSVPSAVVAFRWAGEAHAAENLATELYYLQAAADQGHATAQFLLATYLASGTIGEPNLTTAMVYIQRSARRGFLPAKRRLDQDLTAPETATWLAEWGDAEDCYRLARHTAQQGDIMGALGWYRCAALQGHGAAALVVAQTFYEGKVVKQDPVCAVDFYERAACVGEASAQWALGEAYRNGLGGREKDLALAAMWTRRAAEQGYPAAMMRLAQCYTYGDGVPKDAELAVYWRTRAEEE